MDKKAFESLTNREVINNLQCKKCDETFEMVYKFYYAKLCAYISRFVSTSEAEGIVQNTMMWLWENRDTLIPERSLKSLLFTIAKNKALDKYSHKKVREKVHNALLMRSQELYDNYDLYTEEELSNILVKAIDQLPATYKETFIISRMGGKTHKEIAEELNISKQTVNYHISKSIEILRKNMKDFLPLLNIIL